jgi:methylmalonyl-CoA carboxyltransferase large subunit
MAALVQEPKTSEAANDQLQAALREVLTQLADLSERVAGLETLATAAVKDALPEAGKRSEPAAASQQPAKAAPVVAAGISEEEVLAISAAVAAWLGVQAHIRQIRLIRTGAWAQQGRVTIQASHRLY